MKHALMVGALIGVVTFVEASRAPQAPLSGQTMSVQTTTLEGCLRPGKRDGEFAFTAGADSYAVVPAAGVNLAAHLNHQVQVTGVVEKGSRGSVLHASAVKMVSAACTAA